MTDKEKQEYFECEICGKLEKGSGKITHQICFNCFQEMEYEYSRMEED